MNTRDDLRIQGRTEGDVLALSVAGEARLELVGDLERAVRAGLAAGARHVLLGLSDLGFMDSASAGSLLRLKFEAGERGGRLVLHSLAPAIRRLVDRTGLSEALTIAPDEAAARRLLASPS